MYHMRTLFSSILILLCFASNAQENMTDVPYASIPEASENYTAGTIMSRMIDGLGFRFYWASEGLTAADLKYEPGNEGRSLDQTLDHILGLSTVILNSAKNEPNDRTKPAEKLQGEERRTKILKNLKEASALYLASDDMKGHTIIFKTGKGSSTFPLWNNINGPIEDAVWHAGQIVVLRRSAGNPINPKVNVFLGKLNE